MSNNTIKFNHAPEGYIEYCRGNTVYPDLFTFGAIALTAQNKFTKDSGYTEFATDAEGLEALIYKSRETLGFLQEGIKAISLIMTDQNNEHVKENGDVLAWLLVGLSELSSEISETSSDMYYTLRYIKDIENRISNSGKT